MTSVQDDVYWVYVRRDRSQPFPPEDCERYLTSVATYEEARRIQREFRINSRECVIRFAGETGGGD
jgi:hypothetical protein